MSYTRSVYQKKCSACADTKIGACSRHFFMFMADSKTEELYCRNMFTEKKINTTPVSGEVISPSNLITKISPYTETMSTNLVTLES